MREFKDSITGKSKGDEDEEEDRPQLARAEPAATPRAEAEATTVPPAQSPDPRP